MLVDVVCCNGVMGECECVGCYGENFGLMWMVCDMVVFDVV